MATQLMTMKRLVGPQAVLVDGAGDQLLAGAGFPPDQHGGLGGGDPPDGLVDILHGLAAADDGLAVRCGRGAVHVHRRAHEAPGLQGLLDDARACPGFQTA